MNRSLASRIVALVASLLVTYGLIDSIAWYAYPVPADPVVAVGHVVAPR